MTVYLLHFARPYHHARHYLGFCDRGRLDTRLDEHRRGAGARLMQVLGEAGIAWILVRTWQGNRRLERRLKRWHGSGRLCPVCRRHGR